MPTTPDILTLAAAIRVHGDRCAVISAPESYDSSTIALPEDRARQWFLGQVVGVGDGLFGGERKAPAVKFGQLVLIQANAMMFQQCAVKILGEPAFVIHQNDVIAVLSGAAISQANCAAAGRWVVCTVLVPDKEGQIFLPNGSSSNKTPARYHVLQKGPLVNDDRFSIGDEVVLNRGRATPFKFSDPGAEVGKRSTLCVFCLPEDVYAVLADEDTAANVIAAEADPLDEPLPPKTCGHDDGPCESCQ